MKTIELGTGNSNINDLLKLAESESVLLRTKDGHEYVLADVDDLGHEVELIRQNPELQQLFEERWKDKTAVPLDEVRRRLGLD